MRGRLKIPFARVKPFTPMWTAVTSLGWRASTYTLRRVLVADLIGTQATVLRNSLLIRDTRPIYVVRIAGKMFIRDGHHRATRAFLHHQKTIRAFVLDLGTKKDWEDTPCSVLKQHQNDSH
jgi:hypothetical protein